MIDTELKKKMAAFIKENLTGGSMSEEDIIWIMDECDKGNKPTYDDFVKARKQPKVIESKDIHCKNCKHWLLALADDPCKNCLELDTDQPLGFRHTCFEKKDIVDARDRSMDFGPNMMRQEEFKIPDSIKMIIDQNMKPSIVFPQLDGIKEDIKTYHDDTEKYLTGFSGWLTRIETKVNTIKSHQIDLEKANHAIEEALESVNSKLDILDQRMHDLRQHQILKDAKCVTQVKDISVRPEPLFKVGDKVKLKHGKTVYEVYSITHFICNKKKVYRYKIGHKATTPHYENENRLIKA